MHSCTTRNYIGRIWGFEYWPLQSTIQENFIVVERSPKILWMENKNIKINIMQLMLKREISLFIKDKCSIFLLSLLLISSLNLVSNNHIWCQLVLDISVSSEIKIIRKPIAVVLVVIWCDRWCDLTELLVDLPEPITGYQWSFLLWNSW